MQKALVVATLIVSIAGCAQRPTSVTPAAQMASYSIQSDKSYHLGEAQKAFIGASMIRVQHYTVKSSGIAIPDTSFVMTPWGLGLGGFSASGGATYRISGMITHGGESFYVIPIATTGVMLAQGAALVRSDGSIYDHPLVSGGVIAPDTYSVSPPTAKFNLAQAKDFSGIGGDQNFELIFSIQPRRPHEV